METFPSGAVIGLIGTADSGAADLLQNAGPDVLTFGYEIDTRDAIGKAQAAAEFDRLRRAGAPVAVASHDEEFLRRVADEIWWIRGGRVAHKGDPREVLEAYRRFVVESLRQCRPEALQPVTRRGDGRAELIDLATLDAAGHPVGGWASGDEAVVRVRVRFHAAVDAPVVGILIRTRIGMEVYGTNTELEGVPVGPCEAGAIRRVEFRFRCHLCPQTYTLTAASHDPDGVWHDWMEDALAFTVSDTRHTAGVANLRARVTCCRE